MFSACVRQRCCHSHFTTSNSSNSRHWSVRGKRTGKNYTLQAPHSLCNVEKRQATPQLAPNARCCCREMMAVQWPRALVKCSHRAPSGDGVCDELLQFKAITVAAHTRKLHILCQQRTTSGRIFGFLTGSHQRCRKWQGKRWKIVPPPNPRFPWCV